MSSKQNPVYLTGTGKPLIAAIKILVDSGITIYAGSRSYIVIKDNTGQHLIKCTFNNYCIGLHGQEGTQYEHKLNASEFFILDNDHGSAS